jgi:hypothetical protein
MPSWNPTATVAAIVDFVSRVTGAAPDRGWVVTDIAVTGPESGRPRNERAPASAGYRGRGDASGASRVGSLRPRPLRIFEAHRQEADHA